MGAQQITFPLAFSAGLLSFLSPCVLPLVPIYLGYLTGAGAGNRGVAIEHSRTMTFVHGLVFVIGFSLVFIAWGAIGGAAGELVGHPWFLRVGAIVIIVMGLHLMGVVRIPLLYMERRMEIHRGGEPNLLSSLLIGATFGAGWTPCVGPVLAGILSLAALQGDIMQGAALLSIYSLGLAVPFLLVAAGLGQASAAIRRLGPYLGYIEKASGVLLIFIGFLLFTGQFTELNSIFLRMTPDWLYERL